MRKLFMRLFGWTSGTLVVVAILFAAISPKSYVRAAEWAGLKERRTDDPVQEIRFARATRGRLVVGLTENGVLQAVKLNVVRSKLRRSEGKIAWIVAEGTTVKKDEKVVELETKNLQESLRNEEDSLARAKHSLELETKNVPIETASGASSVAQAQAAFDDAKEALRRYKETDASARTKELLAAVATARKKTDECLDKLHQVQRAAEDEMDVTEEKQKANEQAISNARAEIVKAETGVKAADQQFKSFRTYDYPKTLQNKRLAVKNAELALTKAQVDAEQKLEQVKETISSYEKQISQETKQIEDIKSELEVCVLTAPTDGIVIYGDQSGRWRYYTDKLAPGSYVYQEMPIVSIPDTSSFEIRIGIAEEYRRKISEGAPATVRVTTMPERVFEGKVKRVTQKPGSAVAVGEQAFEGIIELQNQGEGMSTGLTARVEIVAETVEDALLVPIEGVFNVDGKRTCFLHDKSGYTAVEVEPGKSNDAFIEIKKGLSEEQEVYLVDPRSASERAQKEASENKVEPPNGGVKTDKAPASKPSAPPAEADKQTPKTEK